MYTYKDFATGDIRRTRGRFDGYTEPTGLIGARYAIFRNPKGAVLVPDYLLTKETKERVARLDVAPADA